MLERFSLGVQELLDIWRLFLPEETIDFLCRASQVKGNHFRFPDELWVDIIYHFALAQHNKVLGKEHLLKSLTPLYIGKVASFVIEMRDSSSPEVEERLDSLCREFEKQKPLLLDKWA